jgi:hypothetical protein
MRATFTHLPLINEVLWGKAHPVNTIGPTPMPATQLVFQSLLSKITTDALNQSSRLRFDDLKGRELRK